MAGFAWRTARLAGLRKPDSHVLTRAFCRRSVFGRRPLFTVAWGNAPGTNRLSDRLAEGHIQPKGPIAIRWVWIWLSAKRRLNSMPSWGVAPGYGGNRPSAKRNLEVHLPPTFSGLCHCRRGQFEFPARSVVKLPSRRSLGVELQHEDSIVLVCGPDQLAGRVVHQAQGQLIKERRPRLTSWLHAAI